MIRADDREDFMRLARLQPEVLSPDLARLISDGSPLFRLIGHLLRIEDEAKNGLLGNDLTTDTGVKLAIQNQGRLLGRTQVLEDIIGLILEGSENGERERDSGDGSASGDGGTGE